jgi:NADPH:quinone reductase-like Zn-dependent oxidoreductase
MEDYNDHVEPPVQTEESGIPTHQRAWREVRRGAPKVGLELQTDVSVSTQLAPGEVLVRVKASALNPRCVHTTRSQKTQSNPIQLNLCSGYKLLELLPNAVAKRPRTAEQDFSGVVVAQRGATGHQVGDEVFGWVPSSAH